MFRKLDDSIQVDEKSPGHLTLTCNVSKLPLVRTNAHGMFCSAVPCACEEGSKLRMASLQSLVSMFSKP